MYGQDEFNRYYDNIFKSGVSIDDNGSMTLTCNVSGTNLTVSKGFAIVKGFYYYNDLDKVISISRDVNYNRIDRVVIRLYITNKTVNIVLKQGIPGSNTQAPGLQRDNLIYELSLCQISVPKTGNLIVTDERFRSDLCGAIRPRNITEYEDMIKSYTGQIDKWIREKQANMDTWTQTEQSDFASWKTAMKAEFEAWLAQQQGLGWRNIYIQPNTPADSVVGNVWIKTE